MEGPTRTAVADTRAEATVRNFNRAMVRLTLWVLPAVFLMEWIPRILMGEPDALPRWYTYLVFWGTAVLASRMKEPNALILLGPGLAYLIATTILESTVAEDVGGTEAGTALPLIVGLGVVVGAVTTRHFLPVILALCAATGAAAFFTGLEENLSTSDLVIRAVAPVLVLGISSWILRKLRHDLSDAAERLRESVDARDRLVAAVSHELRTPLTGIVGLSEELAVRRDSYTEEEIDEFTSIIAEQGREMADIIDDLLVAARVDADALVVNTDRIDMRDEVERVLKAPRLADMRSEQAIAVRGDGVTALADPLRTRQIIRNLVSNAVRYGGQNITIDLRTENSAVHLEVTDDGRALTQEDVEHIFDPYYTAHDSGASAGSVGLGLSVSRRLARIMHGDLSCRATVGATTFDLELPAASATVVELPRAESA